MIKFNQTSQKRIDIHFNNDHIITLEVSPCTITNKYHLVTSFIENISNTIPNFDLWFSKFLTEYKNSLVVNDNYEVISDGRFIVLERNASEIKRYSDAYIDSKKIDFSKFVDESKSKKNSILFSIKEVEKIIRASSYLKLYSVIFNSENLKLDQRLHKKAYNIFVSDIDEELIFKLFSVIKTKTYKYNFTDRYMWDYIRLVQCKTIDVHVIEIFNFIMNNILILCEEERNPITYFVIVVDESVRWFLRSVYKASVIYDDSISTEDIQTTSNDNLRTYAYNDTLGRLKGIAYKQIHENLEKTALLPFDDKKDESDEYILNLQKRIESVKYISPFCDFLVYPILSKITEIPYSHFKTLSPEHAIVLSVFVQNLMRKVFSDEEYGHLFSMLNFFPKEQPSLITTYKLKNIQNFIATTNVVNNFFGFGTKILLCDMLGNFVGKVSRINFINLYDGKDLVGIPVSRLETEMIHFFALLFSGKLDSEFDKLRHIMLSEF